MNHLKPDQAFDQHQNYCIQKIESIESYYVANDENYPEFPSLDSALKCLADEIRELDPYDYDHLENAYEEVFGEKPDDLEELNDYFQNSSAGVSFMLLYHDESIFCVRFNFNLQEKKLELADHEIEMNSEYEQPLKEIVKTIKSLLSK